MPPFGWSAVPVLPPVSYPATFAKPAVPSLVDTTFLRIGYEIGGKTGTADQPKGGNYSSKKINTFIAVFPTSKPKYVLAVLLDEPKPNKEYVYYYRDGRSPYKGNWRNTAGWTSVEITGKIIEKIGPILATKYMEVY